MSVTPKKFAFALPRGRAAKLGATAAVVAGGLIALDLIGLAATVYFGPELIQAAESAGVAHLLQR
jgi:hypothetical protein